MSADCRERHFIVSDHSVALSVVVEKLAPGDVFSQQQGRIFVDGRRVEQAGCQVNLGSVVSWYASRPTTSPDLEFRILDRRDDFVVVAKPAFWSSEPDRSGHWTSLRERVKRRLQVEDLHVATRLDAGVSGIVLIALGHSACQKVARLQELQHIGKDYLAIALGTVAAESEWNSPVDGRRKALTVSHRLAGSAPARFPPQSETQASLLRINPVTGRHHQIRVHASKCGHPILGDQRYGGPTHYVKNDGAVRTVPRPMLHAWRLRIPWADGDWATVCPAPDDMRNLWADLGGSDCWPES